VYTDKNQSRRPEPICGVEEDRKLHPNLDVPVQDHAKCKNFHERNKLFCKN
jgi:hypothetical protein